MINYFSLLFNKKLTMKSTKLVRLRENILGNMVDISFNILVIISAKITFYVWKI